MLLMICVLKAEHPGSDDRIFNKRINPQKLKRRSTCI